MEKPEPDKPKRKPGRPKGALCKHKVPKNICWVCGQWIQDKTHKTCSLPFCRAMGLLYPQRDRVDSSKLDATAQGKASPKGRYERVFSKLGRIRVTPWEARAVSQIMDATMLQPADWSLHGYTLTKDERGMELSGAKDTIWGFLSRKVVFLKARSRNPGHPALKIDRAPGEHVHAAVRKRFMGSADRNTDKHVDIFFAWMCTCGSGAEVIYETIEDLPTEDGYHDACRNCGAAPVEVITCQNPEKDKLFGLTVPPWRR